jgi:RNA polymerase-binding transcription factor DksA
VIAAWMGDHGRMTDEPRAEISKLLAARAAAVRAELSGLTEAPEDFGTIQFGKRAGDATNVAAEQLSRVGAHEQLQALLADIERAQEKLAAGTYGRCDECGGPIGDARLEALPWAAECVSCRSVRDQRR